MGYKRKTWAEELTEEDLERITEINFKRVSEKILDMAPTSAQFQILMESISFVKTIPAEEVKNLARKALTEKDTSKEELIEIYYRHGVPRRTIHKICKTRDAKITEVMKAEKSYIKKPVYTKQQLQVAIKVISFFTDIFEEII